MIEFEMFLLVAGSYIRTQEYHLCRIFSCYAYSYWFWRGHSDCKFVPVLLNNIFMLWLWRI